MKYDTLETETTQGLAVVRMNRPDLHNAFDDHLIAELTTELRRLDHTPEVRVVV
ncbi:MAG: enoyl-CoA hydratase-related protein, partial [Terriglobales bacterium]